ncbi:MAG: DEAD/DEAH box helicase, partial [Spirochaetes bacterium]|nr:DEAD/DEAH box helicase [Spirochaetota bacterium]
MRTLFRKELDRFFSTSKAFRELRTAFERPEARISVSGPRGTFLPLLIGELHGRRKAVSLVVTPTEREAENVQQDLAGYAEAEGNEGSPGRQPARQAPRLAVELFPWWGTAAYEGASPSASHFGDRVHVLSRLLAREPLLVVAPLRAFLAPVPDPAWFREQRLAVERGQAFDPQATARRLAEMGYLRVPHVSIRGEFAVRGEVIDVFVPGHDRAVRVTLDFDQVGDLRWFNPLDQSSTGSIPSIDIPPAREVVFTPELLETLKAGLLSQGFAEGEVTELVDGIASDPERDGVEAFYPLCFPESHSLLEYLGKDATVFLLDGDRLAANADALRKEHLELYRRARSQKRLVPMPQRLLLDYAGLAGAPARQVDFTTLPPAQTAVGAGGGAAVGAAAGRTHVAIPCDDARSFFGNFTFLREEIETAIASGYKITIFAVYDVQAERLKHILKDLDVAILPLSISAGFTLPEAKLMAIQEGEIFGRKRRIPRSVASAPSTAIESFVELEPGDFVVHVNHGIGVFLGIERIAAAGNERDYIEIEYAEGEKLYLPLEQVNLVQRYIGQEGRRPKLDTLGGRGWQRRKERAKAAVEDLAGSLLDLYSRRKASQGFAFPPDTDWQSEFEAAFPYEETEDQLACIEDVKRDMEAPTVMDRLVCGDVGYGKTEIALRAAFKAVAGGRQVALLAPTTILTEQHYETFKERFARFPVRIEMLSRFREPREVKKVVAAAAEGSVDILIGTHRLIQKDVEFRNLGLLVVDEEQRFGVKHKERLKHLKANVDCLTLTATPIPRTLNMALMKIRDMSVLNTAPNNRLPIETFVSEFDEAIAARAIRAELARGGQVYWLHNRVETIPEIHAFLQRIVPEASVAVGHGQLDEEELEEVMREFVHGERQVL